MKLIETPIEGAWLLDVDPIVDERGFFARTLCIDTLISNGLEIDICQQSISFNYKRGTLRGMHYQVFPYEEVKLVRVTQGAIYDVILDLRADSPTYCHWYASELSAVNRRTLYVPKGVAHGFQTLEDDTEVFYQMTQVYSHDHSCGVRWNDPLFSIHWPLIPEVISQRDVSYPNYN